MDVIFNIFKQIEYLFSVFYRVDACYSYIDDFIAVTNYLQLESHKFNGIPSSLGISVLSLFVISVMLQCTPGMILLEPYGQLAWWRGRDT